MVLKVTGGIFSSPVQEVSFETERHYRSEE